jgi:hypothetical protein
MYNAQLLTAYAAQRARLDATEAAHARRIRLALVRSVATCVAMVEAGATPELAAARVRDTEVIAALTRLYVDCGKVEARLTYNELTTAKAQAPPEVAASWLSRLRSFIGTEGALSVRRITESTRKSVQEVLLEAAAAGDSVQVAARKLRERAAMFARRRSLVIARTELVGAANLGSLLGAQATGLKLEKFWIATPDGRTRDDHAKAGGQGAPLQDGFFVVGGERCRYPGDPMLSAKQRCNCRCSQGYRKPAGS